MDATESTYSIISVRQRSWEEYMYFFPRDEEQKKRHLEEVRRRAKELMDIPCSKDHLLKSSLLEFDSRNIGRQLLKNSLDVSNISAEEGTEQQRRERMLLKWREEQRSGATYLRLYKALQSYGYNDAADEVQQMATACKEFMDIPCSKDHLLKSSSLEFYSSTIGGQLLKNSCDVSNICAEERNDQQRRKRILLKWREEQGSGATYWKLFKVLQSYGYNDAADEVLQMACKDHTFTPINILGAVKSVKDWKMLAIQLEISPTKIMHISAKNHGHVAECRRDLVQFWLQSDVSCSWKKLIDALKSIGETLLAEEIITTYCPLHSVHHFDSSTIGGQLLKNSCDVSNICAEERNDQQRRERMLLKWREEQGSGATYLKLFQVYDAADEVIQMVPACKEAVTKWMPPGSNGRTNCRRFGDGDGHNEHVERNAGMWSFSTFCEGLRDKVQLHVLTLCTWKKRKNVLFSYHLVILVIWLLSGIIGADAFVTISPSADYTTFENNASTFTFNCSGNGTFLYWTVDGYSTGKSYVLNKGIYYTPPLSPDGVTVSSQLIVPTTKANNNTVVVCTVLDASFGNRQSSDPVRLILQEFQTMLSPTTNASMTFTAGPGNTGAGYIIPVAVSIVAVLLLLLLAMVVGVVASYCNYPREVQSTAQETS